VSEKPKNEYFYSLLALEAHFARDVGFSSSSSEDILMKYFLIVVFTFSLMTFLHAKEKVYPEKSDPNKDFNLANTSTPIMKYLFSGMLIF